MENVRNLIEASFPDVKNFKKEIDVKIECLENARSFWSECYRVTLTPKNAEIMYKVVSPLFIKVSRISDTNSCLDADNEEENTKILLKLSERETQFLNDFRNFDFKNFPIPRNFLAIDIDLDKTPGGLVSEDLSGFAKSVQYIPGFTDSQMLQILRALAGFHFSVLSKSNEILWENYENSLYDADYINMLYNDTLDLENIVPDQFAGKIQSIKHIFNTDSVRIAQESDKLQNMPEVLSHNDLNSSNILWNTENGKIAGFIDFQHLARGSIVFDIIRLLTLGLSVEKRRENTIRYLQFYYDSLAELLGDELNFTFEQLLLSFHTHFGFVSATTLFGCYYYYKMYNEDSINLAEKQNSSSDAQEILNRALGIIEDIEKLRK
ncbi:unnamed protein product [Caenorhabditis angaria]|uniref:CHK kinase-like domain-containing protein n=1 Tax=Caenorhabditis angaria TaxID=860376 RepID=A0A9P1IIJ7_9PELO|nr:unnamed protein product [Caenorhabditis angaria]